LFPSNLTSQAPLLFFCKPAYESKKFQRKAAAAAAGNKRELLLHYCVMRVATARAPLVHISLACHTHSYYMALFGGSGLPMVTSRERARMKEILPTQNAQTDTANARAVFFSPQTFFHACCSQLNHKVASLGTIFNCPRQARAT
jgi:hypothetical protein